jgi:hypothetical protein
MQVECPCAGGGSGVQVCNADGSGYGGCESCGSPGDAGLDVTVSRDGRADGPAADVSPEASVEGGGGCVYPTDGVQTQDASSTLPQPTDGQCQGNTAFTCNPTSHTLEGTACGSGETCTVYAVTEHPDVTLTRTGRTYQWAGCIPAGATPCTFSWSANPPNTVPSGSWLPSYTGKCQGNDALRCTMAPVITDQAYLDEWAGTTTGYVHVTTCGSGEACADDPRAPGNPDCYTTPLVPCSPVANSTCTGDVLNSCDGRPFQVRVDCAAQGQTCREDCPIGLPNTSAECRDPLPSSATACNPATFTTVCAGSTSIQDCNPGTFNGSAEADCFMAAGQCVCYPTSHPCSEIGCGIGSTNCKCANVVSQGAECIPANAALCDPSTTADFCQGTVATTCIGYVATLDCAPLGEICQVAGGHSGCIASPAKTCSASVTPSCSGNTLSGCCPASGEFVAGNYSVPCAPGYAVAYSCPALSPTLSCKTSLSGGACSM